MIAQNSVSARKSSYLSYYEIIAIISTSLPNYIIPRSKVLNLSEFPNDPIRSTIPNLR